MNFVTAFYEYSYEETAIVPKPWFYFFTYTVFVVFPASFNFFIQRHEEIGTHSKVFMQTLQFKIFNISRSQNPYLSVLLETCSGDLFPPINR